MITTLKKLIYKKIYKKHLKLTPRQEFVSNLHTRSDGLSFMMKPDDVQHIEKIILSLNLKHIDVLEWGPGEGTKYFVKFLKKSGITYTWEALEYNFYWYLKVLLYDLPRVRIHLFLEPEPNDRKSLWSRPMNEYVSFPNKLGKKYDFILIDGRKRKRCLETATTLLNKNGVVVLHDAFRKYYQEGFKGYDGSFLNRSVWMGKIKKSQE